MTESEKKWIDEADYETLLRRWRMSPVGDPLFQGDTGRYYSDVMNKKRAQVGAEHVATSKRIGWGGDAK